MSENNSVVITNFAMKERLEKDFITKRFFEIKITLLYRLRMMVIKCWKKGMRMNNLAVTIPV